MTKLGVFIILSFVVLFEAKEIYPLARFWTVSCDANQCQNAFDLCIEKKCYGSKACKAIVDEHYSNCSGCVNQLLDQSHYESINGTNYLVCDKQSSLQIKGCVYFCRTKFYPKGECIRQNRIPICRCFDDETDETTKITTVTTTLAPVVTTTISTTTTAMRNPCDPYGIQNNIDIMFLTSTCGYKIVYNFQYSYATTKAQLDKIRSSYCKVNSTICVGGTYLSQTTLLVVACGDCYEIMSLNTDYNKPILINGAYWYSTNYKSFGFAPSPIINQFPADTENLKSNQRLSWHIDGIYGGWRLGTATELNSDNNYYKVILIA